MRRMQGHGAAALDAVTGSGESSNQDRLSPGTLGGRAVPARLQRAPFIM